MKINIVEKYTAAVIELRGDITGGPHNDDFSNTLKKLLAGEKKNIVIDLAETKYMNSSGLGMLISGYTTVKNSGGDLKLANVTKKIESLLVITKLSTIFENYSSVDEAVKSFS
jgi:anti-sigma B factor antagonist